ncbi:hypothetical protein MTYP_02633 [Methylophilaceae bacterium]|nr:hypothetical protein MTYP_02633 [Methylophilaceae bacterium]
MRYLFAFLLLILCLLLFGFAIKNVEPVELHYYLGFSWKAPLSLMLLTGFLVGVVTGMLICLRPVIAQRKRVIALKRELKTLKTNTQS